jgi:hypothetical protein
MFFRRKKIAPVAVVAPTAKIRVSDDVLLKEAYRTGRFSPTNCECPPAPDIIPVWIENNLESFGIYSGRLFEKYEIPPEFEPRLFQAMFQGFRDLIRSCPDGKDSPFCLSAEEIIFISKTIFIRLAQKRGVSLDIAD